MGGNILWDAFFCVIIFVPFLIVIGAVVLAVLNVALLVKLARDKAAARRGRRIAYAVCAIVFDVLGAISVYALAYKILCDMMGAHSVIGDAGGLMLPFIAALTFSLGTAFALAGVIAWSNERKQRKTHEREQGVLLDDGGLSQTGGSGEQDIRRTGGVPKDA